MKQGPCRKVWVWCAVLALGWIMAGCDSGKDAAVVDFSRIVSTDAQGPSPLGEPSLHVAVAAMISPKETFRHYRSITDYVGSKIGRRVEMVQRKTYLEIHELLAEGQIDWGFVCSGLVTWKRHEEGIVMLATPQVRGEPFYRAYLIVSADSPIRTIEDLRGKVFAFTDPYSNTGRAVPLTWLAERGETAERFFRRTLFTYSHDNSILAVARDLVDGAAVDSLVYDYYRERDPSFTAKTRIVLSSPPYGAPPVVASGRTPVELRNRVREILLSMHLEIEGRRILEELRIDRFVAPQEAWYRPIRSMWAQLYENQTH